MSKKLKKIELRKQKLLSQKKVLEIFVENQLIGLAYYYKLKNELLLKTYSFLSSEVCSPENRTNPYRVSLKLKEIPQNKINFTLEDVTSIEKVKDYRIRKKSMSHKTYYFDTTKYRIEYEYCWKKKILNNHIKSDIRKRIESETLIKLDQIHSVTDLLIELSNSESVANQPIFLEALDLFVSLTIKKIKKLPK